MLPGISAVVSARDSTGGGCSAHPETNPYARTRLWCFIKTVLNSTWAALHRSSLSDFRLPFCVKATEVTEEFKSSSDIPVLWYASVGILTSQGSPIFFNFQSKAYQRRMSSRPPTHTYGQDWKRFSYHERIYMFQKFCWRKLSRITSILSVFTSWNTGSLSPLPSSPQKTTPKMFLIKLNH